MDELCPQCHFQVQVTISKKHVSKTEMMHFMWRDTWIFQKFISGGMNKGFLSMSFKCFQIWFCNVFL